MLLLSFQSGQGQLTQLTAYEKHSVVPPAIVATVDAVCVFL